MALCLSKLPSVCLEAIFERLPLVDLIRSIGLVCTSWYKSRRTELMRRKRLVLLEDTEIYSLNDYRNYSSSHTTELIQHVRRDDGSPWLTLESLAAIELNALAVPGGMQTIPFILQLKNFSSITRLHLFFDFSQSDSVLEQLIMLIEHLSNHLVDLKILMNFDLDINVYNHDTAQNELNPNVANLFICLNRLPSLKHLQLRVSFSDYSTPSPIPELLSCLSRLTTFAFDDLGYGWLCGWVFASLKQYARNVTSIDMHTAMDLQDMPQFDNQLAGKFNVLTLLFDGLPGQCYDAMRQFCSRFSSLTKLELAQSLNFMPMTMLARCLSLLPQLVHLHLRLDNIPPVEEGQPEEEEEGDEMQQDRAQPEIVQVSSVRLLTLSPFITKSHLDSERLFIPEIFPNLQVLCLDHRFTECPECAIGPPIGGYYDIYLAHRIITCTRLTRQPFRRCANLHTVALGYSETLITRDLDEL